MNRFFLKFTTQLSSLATLNIHHIQEWTKSMALTATKNLERASRSGL